MKQYFFFLLFRKTKNSSHKQFFSSKILSYHITFKINCTVKRKEQQNKLSINKPSENVSLCILVRDVQHGKKKC